RANRRWSTSRATIRNTPPTTRDATARIRTRTASNTRSSPAERTRRCHGTAVASGSRHLGVRTRPHRRNAGLAFLGQLLLQVVAARLRETLASAIIGQRIRIALGGLELRQQGGIGMGHHQDLAGHALEQRKTLLETGQRLRMILEPVLARAHRRK